MSVTTLNRLLDDCLARHPRNDAFSRRINGRYEDISTEAFARRVRYLGLGLIDLGIKPGDRVALLSENRIEWAVADLAILSIGGINTPIYATLPPPQIRYILEDSKVRAVIVSNAGQLEKIREISGDLSRSIVLVAMESLPGSDDPAISFDFLYDRGRTIFRRDPALFMKISRNARPGDVATVIYTSGTSGPPKGVLLSHHNILSNIQAVLKIIPVGRTDKVLSFLPLSHILERMAGYYAIMYAGGSIAYAGSSETIREDIDLSSPTMMITVPRFLEKVHENIMENASHLSLFPKWAFEWSIRAGYRRLENLQLQGSDPWGRPESIRLANSLVFSKIKKGLGGKIRFFISGGAPLPLHVSRFFHAVGIPVYEGYGLTETSPVVSCNSPIAWRLGSVGRPVPGVDVKTARNGEILVRGPNVMLGYLGKDRETKDALKDGWFHTGDIGRIDDEGYLYITDRKKDIIVTSGGKNIAPQPIEALLKASDFIKEAVLIGNDRRYVTALIVPNFERFQSIADSTKPAKGGPPTVIEDPEIRRIIQAEIREQCRDLAPYEQIKKFLLVSRNFRIADDEVTPTLKVRRHYLEKRYRDLIDRMYE